MLQHVVQLIFCNNTAVMQQLMIWLLQVNCVHAQLIFGNNSGSAVDTVDLSATGAVSSSRGCCHAAGAAKKFAGKYTREVHCTSDSCCCYLSPVHQSVHLQSKPVCAVYDKYDCLCFQVVLRPQLPVPSSTRHVEYCECQRPAAQHGLSRLMCAHPSGGCSD